MLIDIDRSLHGNASSPAASTHRGMAHFAGTGPQGTSCGQCEFWQKNGERARNETCFKARSMGVRVASAIPSGTRSCKYFNYRPAAK